MEDERSNRPPLGRQGRVTGGDVAAAANVPPGTVSRALRGDPMVKLATQQLIRRLAEEMNYRPNLSARALRTGHCGTLALACAAGSWVLHHPYFAPLHSGLIAAAAERGVRVTVYLPPPGDVPVYVAKHSWAKEMLNGQVDGCVIYQSQLLSLDSLQYLRDAKLPVVLMNVDREIPGFFQLLAHVDQRIRDSLRWGHEMGCRRFVVLGLGEGMPQFNWALRRGVELARLKCQVHFQAIAADDPDRQDAVDAAITAALAWGPDAIIFNSGYHLIRFHQAHLQGPSAAGPRLFYHEASHHIAPWALPGVHYLEADLLGAGRLAYGLVEDAQRGAPLRSEGLQWRRRA